MGMNVLQPESGNLPGIKGNVRYGLVLSGGGIRFATHAGILMEMANWVEDGKPWLEKFDVLVGTSAGALYAGLYAAGYTPAHIATFALLFAGPKLKNALFDWNVPKLAAAFLQHDFSHVLGASSGDGVLSLLETLLTQGMPKILMNLYPEPNLKNIDKKALEAVEQALIEAWDKRKKQPRGSDYYKNLITFADCEKELYLIGVNGYTGQKTVFGKLPNGEDQCEALDESMYRAHQPIYINPQTKWKAELADLTKNLDLTRELQFRRYENRLYHGFDSTLYPVTETHGPQLPVALAVRASVSLPVFFEPARIQRAGLVPGSIKHEQDLFLDGGVDDNFSLSVAADECLGKCTHILGISLGNLGYRFPEPNAMKNVVTILLNTTDYLGEAILDQQQTNSHLLKRHITIINALPSIGAEITDTEKMGDLIKESTGMAGEFWEDAHRGEPPGGSLSYPSSTAIAVDSTQIFSEQTGIRIWCSKTARSGTPSFTDLKKGSTELPTPHLADVFLGIPRVLYDAIQSKLARGWAGGYVALLFMSFGVVTFISDLLDSIAGTNEVVARLIMGFDLAGWGGLIFRILVAFVVIFALRLGAFIIWQRYPRAIVANTRS